MVNILQRFKAAARAFSGESRVHYVPAPGAKAENKALNLVWPSISTGEATPTWNLVDVDAFFREGYALNTLIYSAVMFKIRATVTAPLRAYTGSLTSPEPLPEDDELSRRIRMPNKHQTWEGFHARNILFFNVAGNVFLYTDPDTGDVYSLNPNRVLIVPEPMKSLDEPDPTRGILGYIYRGENQSYQTGKPILPENMNHIKLPNPLDPLEGLGYGMAHVQPAAHSTDVDNMITKFLNLFFESGAMLTGVLSYDMPLKEDYVDAILESWQAKWGGWEKWKVGVLDRGGKYQRVALTIEEMGFEVLDSRNESRILAPFGVPAILIGAKVGLEQSTYSNYEAARAAVWEDTLVPELTWFQKEYQQTFGVPPEGPDSKFVAFDLKKVPALQRGTIRQVNAAYTLFQMGVPRDQAIRTVGLEVGPTPGGDLSIMPTGRGVQQGPRANPEEDGWSMHDNQGSGTNGPTSPAGPE